MTGVRFLVVEEDPAYAENLLELLHMEGHFAEHAPTAAEARRLASSGTYEVALVDLGLPDARGIDLVTELKERLPFLITIVLTAQPTLHSARDAIRSGATAYLVKDGDPRELEAVIRRTGEQAGLARSLRESEARYAILVERAPLGIALVRDGRYAFVNERYARIFGCSEPRSLVGAQVEDVYHPEDREKVRVRWTSDGEPWPETYVVSNARGIDGRPIEVQVMRARLELNGRAAVQILVRDVTEENRLSRELEEARAQIEEKRRLAALGEMVAGIAHEVRNPLQSVEWGITELRGLCDGRHDLIEPLSKIERGTSEIEKIVAEVLDFARPMRVDAIQFPLRDLLESTREDMAGAALQAGVDLTVERTEGPDDVLVDALKIKQALVNLVTNAIEASPAGSTVVLRARRGARPNEAVVFEVLDEGAGVRPDLRDKIYLPFVTTKVKGTGLGLAITRRIVEAHGGTIHHFPRQPRGTLARMVLPTAARLG